MTVLKPGGLAISVVGPPDPHPWLGVHAASVRRRMRVDLLFFDGLIPGAR